MCRVKCREFSYCSTTKKRPLFCAQTTLPLMVKKCLEELLFNLFSFDRYGISPFFSFRPPSPLPLRTPHHPSLPSPPLPTPTNMSFPGLALQRTWHLVDATNQTVGRLATTIAPILRGKHKPTFRPSGDCGDFVVIINADKVSLDLLNV